MRRFIILTIVTCALLGMLPQRAHAANLAPSILPKCDQTKYIIQSKSGSPAGTKEIVPEEFDKPPYLKADWSVVDYTVNENCGFNDMLQLFVNLFNWGLYVLSILALFFFFLGGGTLLLSGGSEERVRTGKAILVNTVIGLSIALSSWVIVNLTINALLPEDSIYHKDGIGALVANQPWFRVGPSEAYNTCGEPPQYPCKDSERVRLVQEKLLNAQCYVNPGPRNEVVDGNFGPKTRDAWHNLQRANGKPETDEISGEDDLRIPCLTNSDTPV